jgi:poly-gamma-glutamate synthesis protein (capsule biosynthesis protein)
MNSPRPAWKSVLAFRRSLLVGVCLLTVTACAGAAVPPPEGPPTTITLTPFLPTTATPTPEVIRLWIAPSVPPALNNLFVERIRASGQAVLWVKVEEEAAVRLQPSEGIPFAQWTYALVAPFPTIEDGLSWESLVSTWQGEIDEGHSLLVTADVDALMQALLGPSDAGAARSPAETLMDQAWGTNGALSVVPFEDLQPRWKVFEIDGRSPIRKDYAPEGYPLQVTFGLDGEPQAVARLAQALGLPDSVEANRQPDRLTTIVITGVTALTRATAWTMSVKGADYPAELVGDWLGSADITHVSNEVAFDPDCPPPSPDLYALTFCSQPDHVSLLETIGVDVIELTGNHVLDAGARAFLYSMDLYDERGWATFGGGRDLSSARRPALFEHNGNRIAFLGCNEAGPTGAWAREDAPGAMPCGTDRLRAEIEGLRQDGYLPIFTFQWHEHYVAWPAASQRQTFLAAAAAGAAVVSGSQAHQPQGFEFAGDSFVHYGLGNLFFDQMWSQAVRQEFIDRYVVYDGRLVSVELLTALLEDFAQPRPMTDAERASFLGMIFTASGW